VSYDRDVGDFDKRAPTYETGWLGRLHRDIADKVADIALSADPRPQRVLDVGCGTGYLLRQLAARLPEAELAGIDPAPHMVEQATANSACDRVSVQPGVAEALPFGDDRFDLVISTTSFDHWTDQRAGIAEIARVLRPKGHLVLADLFSIWMVPTLLLGHRGRVRTIAGASSLVRAAGLEVVGRHNLYVVVQAISARK
jgi:ubiquinone/menaquinone biosynthesis C-methylase UbiE